MELLRTFLAHLDALLQRVPRRFSQSITAALFLVPGLSVLVSFGLAPMVYAVYMSFFDLTGAAPRFIGTANYTEAFTGTPFRNSLLTTFYYAAGTVPITIAASFVIALGLFRVRFMTGLLRTAFFLPYVTSIVAAAMIWRVLLEPSYGAANQLFDLLGLPEQRWLLEPRGILHLITDGAVSATFGPSLSLCCVVVFEIWRSTGFMVVVFLGGLSAIPRELEEAARVDGASATQVMRNVILPLLSPTLFFLAIVGVIGAFQAFSSVYALTGGRGPLDTTQNLTVYIYSNLYEFGRLGYGAAVSVLLCAATALLTLLQWRVARRRVFYQ